MFDICTRNKISPVGLDCFDKNKYNITDEIENPEAILVRSASLHEMEIGDSLLAVARAGAGVNNIPCVPMAEKGVVVFNTPGANANAVKEMVLAALFLTSRDIIGGIEWAKTLKDEGDNVPSLVEKGKSQFVGPEISGKTIGVIGLGAIGVMVANACISLGMEVLGYDPYISVDAAWGLSRKVTHVSSLKDIYAHSDYITIHVPYIPQTKGYINAEAIATMKSGVKILNFARGELVDTDDILAAIDSGRVGKYITDFPVSALIGNKNVIAVPHLGASTPESEDNCARMAAMQLVDFLENGNIVNSVNMPDAVMGRSGKQRLCIIHKNSQGMLSKISTAISDASINITNMLNKSQKDFAYTMIDMDTPVSTSDLDVIRKIDGVIKLRLI